MTEQKQNYSAIIVRMKSAQQQLEDAKEIANFLTGESFTTGVVTACHSLVSNFVSVLEQAEMIEKDKKGEQE